MLEIRDKRKKKIKIYAPHPQLENASYNPEIA